MAKKGQAFCRYTPEAVMAVWKFAMSKREVDRGIEITYDRRLAKIAGSWINLANG